MLNNTPKNQGIPPPPVCIDESQCRIISFYASLGVAIFHFFTKLCAAAPEQSACKNHVNKILQYFTDNLKKSEIRVKNII